MAKRKKGTKSEDSVKLVEKLAKELLALMGVNAQVEVSEDKANDAILINLKSEEEKGLIIGRRGETINSLQAALGMMLMQKTGEWERIIVNIGDWREKQKNYLENLAMQAAHRTKETNEPQTLYNLSPGERRVVHLALADVEGVETESTGEGKERYLIVKPVKK
jgi:spoIIIJ-associated protein